MTSQREISKAFNQQATGYEAVAKIQKEVGQRLFERLDYLKIAPKRILDLGCGPGFFSRALALKYPKAQVVSLDLAQDMLLMTQKKQRFWRKWLLVQADMQQMPFEEGCFDLVFANQVIHWGSSLKELFRELNRVMNVEGCLMFTTLGPDTFKELNQAWSGVDPYKHSNDFPDMHDVGDCLVGEYFLDPVMDMEFFEMHYDSPEKLARALKAQGVKNIHSQRNPGLTTKSSWQQFLKGYETFKTKEGKYPLSYEVVYGHAWKGVQRNTLAGIETAIPLSQIQKTKKTK